MGVTPSEPRTEDTSPHLGRRNPGNLLGTISSDQLYCWTAAGGAITMNPHLSHKPCLPAGLCTKIGMRVLCKRLFPNKTAKHISGKQTLILKMIQEGELFLELFIPFEMQIA